MKSNIASGEGAVLQAKERAGGKINKDTRESHSLLFGEPLPGPAAPLSSE